MIDTKTFELDWIMGLSETYGRGRRKANPELIEKVTKALHLLELLSQCSLQFVFKGGTSLLLLLNEVHRFSIDIDIIVEEEKEKVDIKSILDSIISKSTVFKSYEENVRRKNDIPKAHYKLYYDSVTNPANNAYILLDILFEDSHYEETIEKEINCPFIAYSNPPVKVKMPSINSILGDKLTAFAPTTTGIPYGRDKELEIIKQLFDIENLFNEMENKEVLSNTFKKFAEQELVYRNKQELGPDDVLLDIFFTSIIICANGAVINSEFQSLQEGIKRISDYIFTRNYILRDAIVSASKAAYLSQVLMSGNYQIDRYRGENVESWKVNIPLEVREEGEYWRTKNINNVKKISPEAFFYIYKALEIHYQRIGTVESIEN